MRRRRIFGYANNSPVVKVIRKRISGATCAAARIGRNTDMAHCRVVCVWLRELHFVLRWDLKVAVLTTNELQIFYFRKRM